MRFQFHAHMHNHHPSGMRLTHHGCSRPPHIQKPGKPRYPNPNPSWNKLKCSECNLEHCLYDSDSLSEQKNDEKIEHAKKKMIKCAVRSLLFMVLRQEQWHWWRKTIRFWNVGLEESGEDQLGRQSNTRSTKECTQENRSILNTVQHHRLGWRTNLEAWITVMWHSVEAKCWAKKWRLLRRLSKKQARMTMTRGPGTYIAVMMNSIPLLTVGWKSIDFPSHSWWPDVTKLHRFASVYQKNFYRWHPSSP